jgi:hypothetical protein
MSQAEEAATKAEMEKQKKFNERIAELCKEFGYTLMADFNPVIRIVPMQKPPTEGFQTLPNEGPIPSPIQPKQP